MTFNFNIYVNSNKLTSNSNFNINVKSYRIDRKSYNGVDTKLIQYIF